MIDRSLPYIKCTHCGAGAPPLYSREDGGGMRCGGCGFVFPIVHDCLLMIAKERDQDTLEKFEHQWRVWGDEKIVFGKSSLEYENRYLQEFKNPALAPEWFRGKRTLDAGCGHGIMVEVFDRLGAESVGLELGDGIFAASRRLAGTGTVLVQGDILDTPFQPESFDYVYSNGVIHHTRDTREAFRKLAALVRPGGGLDVWLYPQKGLLWETVMAWGRMVTTRVPPRLLSRLVYLLIPLLYVVPTWSRTLPRTHSLKQCAQVIYDWLSPRYQSHHTFDEVKRWYEEEGFTMVGQIETTPLAMYGTKNKVTAAGG